MDNPLDFLGISAEPAPVAEAPVVEPVAVEPVAEQPAAAEPAPVAEPAPAAAAADPPRAPDGKFISPKDAPLTPAAEPGHVPISALLDEREKRQQSEREIERLNEQLRSNQPPPEAPQIDEDTARLVETRVLSSKLDISEDMARQRHGDELVEAAQKWGRERMAKSPDFAREVLSERNPYERVVQEYQRDQIVQSLKPGDLDAFRAWQAAQANPPAIQPVIEPAAPALVPAAPPAPAAPPRSIAQAPSAGGMQTVPSGPGQAFDSLFNKG